MSELFYMLLKTGPLEGTLGHMAGDPRRGCVDKEIAYFWTQQAADKAAEVLNEAELDYASKNDWQNWYSYDVCQETLYTSATEFIEKRRKDMRDSISDKLTRDEKKLAGWKE